MILHAAAGVEKQSITQLLIMTTETVRVKPLTELGDFLVNSKRTLESGSSPTALSTSITVKGCIKGILTSYRENNATTPSLCYNIILEYQEKK